MLISKTVLEIASLPLLTAKLHSRCVKESGRKFWKAQSRKILEARNQSRTFLLRLRNPALHHCDKHYFVYNKNKFLFM